MIRTAHVQDLISIQQLIQPYIADFAINPKGQEKFSLLFLEKLLLSTEIDYFVDEDAEKIRGLIAYTSSSHLLHFFVDQSYQRQGIGRKLWNFVLERLETNGSTSITVNSSLYAVPIYQKIGFHIISDVCEFEGIRFVKMLRDKGE